MVKKLEKTKIVPYNIEDMYMLVSAVDAYPDFVPYCSASGIKSETDKTVEAYLTLGFHGVEKTISTVNTMYPHTKIEMRLTGGPLDSLVGVWHFHAIQPHCTKIILQLAYAISHPIYGPMVASMIDGVADVVLSAFEKRAGQIYG